MFVLEIIIKWIDGFWDFWKNGWNIFDFFVTVMVRCQQNCALSWEEKNISESVAGNNVFIRK